MPFVLPYHKDMRFENDTPVSKLLSFVMPWMKGRRPVWLIRLGLFMYDHMGARKTQTHHAHAHALVNASGPWVKELLTGPLNRHTSPNIRLVRGSHIVVPRLFDHDRAYFFKAPTDASFLPFPMKAISP